MEMKIGVIKGDGIGPEIVDEPFSDAGAAEKNSRGFEKRSG